MAILEGAIDCVRHDDGRVEVRSAPPRITMSLEFLVAADPHLVKVVSGDRLRFAGQVEYTINGWDPLQKAVLAERVG